MKLKDKNERYLLEKAEIFKSLSSPLRLQLINFISFCPRTVEDCSKKIGQSIQNTSLHLASLMKAGILEVEKVKNYRFYSLTDSDVAVQIRKLLRACDGALLPSDLIWEESLNELALRVKKKETFLIDLRSSDERAYIQLNTPYAFDDSLKGLTDFLQSHFSKQDNLIFSCKGKTCERLAEAVSAAQEAHYQVKGLTLDAEELFKFGEVLR